MSDQYGFEPWRYKNRELGQRSADDLAMADYGKQLEAMGAPQTGAFIDQTPAFAPQPPPRPEIAAAVAKNLAKRRGLAVAPPPKAAPLAVVDEPAPAGDDSDVESEMSDRLAARKDELGKATSLRDERQGGANLFEAIGQMAQGASHAQGDYDGSFYGKLRDQAGQGVTDVGTRQKMAGEELTQVDKERDIGRKTELGDPNSTQSAVARNVARRRLKESGADPNMITNGMSALDVDALEKSVTGLESSATRKATSADARAAREQTARIAAEARADARTTGKIHTLTASQTDAISSHDAALKQLDDLEAAVGQHADSMGPIYGNVGAANPYDTKSQGFQSKLQLATQNIGKALEGGKLAEGDIKRYLRMLPKITDTPDVAKEKIANLRQLTQQRRATDIAAAGNAGYDVARFPSASPRTPTAAPGGEVVRKTQDGRLAVFDPATKAFLRYQE